jgi:hypothetical protein
MSVLRRIRERFGGGAHHGVDLRRFHFGASIDTVTVTAVDGQVPSSRLAAARNSAGSPAFSGRPPNK